MSSRHASPAPGGDAARKLRGEIRAIAQKAFTRAKEKKAVGDLTTARDELARAAALDPGVEGVREMQRELRSGYPILYVGVRQFPLNLSPITARVDSEKQAVELIFEGLLEEVPDESGGRPLPTRGTAVQLPIAIPGGRDFTLRTFERDATGQPGFDSHDMVGTVKLLHGPLGYLGSVPASVASTRTYPLPRTQVASESSSAQATRTRVPCSHSSCFPRAGSTRIASPSTTRPSPRSRLARGPSASTAAPTPSPARRAR